MRQHPGICPANCLISSADCAIPIPAGQDIRDKYTAARESAVDSRKRTEVKHKIQKVVQELNNLLLKEDKKRHVPDSMKKAVAAALDFIQLDTVNSAEKIAKYDALIAEAKDPDVIDSLMVTRQNFVDKGEKIGARLKELHEAYADIMVSDDPDISSGVDPVIDGNLRERRETIGDTPFSKLPIEQLEDLYSMYKSRRSQGKKQE